jgi:hypothetical protein
VDCTTACALQHPFLKNVNPARQRQACVELLVKIRKESQSAGWFSLHLTHAERFPSKREAAVYRARLIQCICVLVVVAVAVAWGGGAFTTARARRG